MPTPSGPAVPSTSSTEKREQPAIVIADREGTIAWSSERALERLSIIFGSRAEAEEAIRELVLDAHPGSAGRLVGESHVLRCSRLDGPGEMSMIAIESTRRRDRVDVATERFRLTQRETDVARLLVEGHNTATIASSLHIAETTVVDHIKKIGLKTGTPRRMAIVAALLGLEDDRRRGFLYDVSIDPRRDRSA